MLAILALALLTGCPGPNTGGGGGGGGDTDGGSDDGGVTTLGLKQLAVGGWTASGTCGTTQLSFGWFICPGSRLRGYHTIMGYDFLDCGTWTVVSEQRFTASVTDTAVIDGSKGHTDYTIDYDAANDQIVFASSCPVRFDRVTGGQVTEADCSSSTCSAGGTGPVQCGTDCDCGRCWYCESGTCRYGGEGPYGCYRGCGE